MPEKQSRQPRTSQGTRGRNKGEDARGNAERLKDNQQRLGVGPEHKTDAMKRGHRGTFP